MRPSKWNSQTSSTTADDVVRYVKNEKLGFSVTYFEGGRPRQYFPDFVVAWQPASGAERFMVIETKGEIFPNTHLKSEAAKLWCDRMTAAGHEGDWSYLFVHQPVFNKALSNGVVALTDLATLIEGRADQTGAGALFPLTRSGLRKRPSRRCFPSTPFTLPVATSGQGRVWSSTAGSRLPDSASSAMECSWRR